MNSKASSVQKTSRSSANDEELSAGDFIEIVEVFTILARARDRKVDVLAYTSNSIGVAPD
jgi:hypothetical protein